MRKRRLFLVGAAAASSAAAAALLIPALVGATSAGGALQNVTPGTVKVFHTGGSQPSAQWADLGRLTLPVGSFVVMGGSTLVNKGQTPTAIECYLRTPVASAHSVGAVGTAKGSDVARIDATVAVDVPNGGNVDLVCRVTAPAADRRVFAQDTTITAIAVQGVTVTRNQAPASAF